MTASPSMARARAALIPLFLISAGVVGYENALTRYFAVAKWSEYGYWVISIVMVGFALSGVVVALFRDPIARHGAWIRALSPAAMVVAAAAGYHYVTLNPFNPLQLQNATTWLPQIADIGLYYACLLPFFFLAGVYVSLSFVLNAGEIGRVYAYDLIGAGLGSAATLLLMFGLHPYLLMPVLLAPLAASALFQPGRGHGIGVAAAVVALLIGEGVLFLDTPAPVNDFKALYAPLHTPGARVLDEVRSPRGDYVLADDFTERVDTDVSNDAGMLGLSGPPRTLGLYRDGNRIAALPKAGALDVGYAHASLDAAPYLLRPAPRVLLVGASGGYRIAEVLALGAAHVDALEPEPVLRSALLDGLDGSQRLTPSARVRVLSGGPVETARNAGPHTYDLIDISGDFLDAAEANETAFTAQAIAGDLRALAPDGLISIPVSIKDLPVYAVRMLATTREGLRLAGIADAPSHVVVYRSAWGVRILISPTAWSADRIAALKKFCDDRSFDVSYYPGIDVKAVRASLYNDLPQVSFTSGEITSTGPDDAVADEAGAVLAGRPTASEEAFNLTPITLDRPAFHAVLRLSHPDTLLNRLEILPQGEIGGLVNLAVLAQAIVFALLVLATPLLVVGRARKASADAPKTEVLRPVIYFSALGLGFLFLEIFLIEQVSVYLNDRTSAFALVLTGMLIFSGLGSLIAERLKRWPHASVAVAGVLVLAWCAAMFWRGETAMMTTLGQPWPLRALIALAVTAPLSIALGLPFPLGLTRVGTGAMLPWVWGLNGAFSVVATPLANLLARQAGYSKLLIAAAVLYVIVMIAMPPIVRAGRGGEALP